MLIKITLGCEEQRQKNKVTPSEPCPGSTSLHHSHCSTSPNTSREGQREWGPWSVLNNFCCSSFPNTFLLLWHVDSQLQFLTIYFLATLKIYQIQTEVWSILCLEKGDVRKNSEQTCQNPHVCFFRTTFCFHMFFYLPVVCHLDVLYPSIPWGIF